MNAWATIALVLGLAGAPQPAPSGGEMRVAQVTETSRQALIKQRNVVEKAAAEAARSRSDGSRRAEVKRLMAEYREAAQTLAAMEAAAAVRPDEQMAAVASAQAELAEAVAEGSEQRKSRQILAQWLGELNSRLGIIENALAAAGLMTDEALEAAVNLDAAEQSLAVMLAASYDAQLAHGRAKVAQSRADGLRRAAPGQGGGLDAAVNAARFEQEAAQYEAQAAAARETYARAAELRTIALMRLE